MISLLIINVRGVSNKQCLLPFFIIFALIKVRNILIAVFGTEELNIQSA